MLYAVLSTDTQNTLKYHLVTVKPSFAVKTFDCLHQTLTDRTYREENGKVRYVTHMLHHDYHIRSGVCHCVKNGSSSSANLELKLIDSIAGLSYYLNKY